jgi:hypothetical protein
MMEVATVIKRGVQMSARSYTKRVFVSSIIHTLTLMFLGISSFSQVSTCVSDKITFDVVWEMSGVGFMKLVRKFLTTAAATKFVSRDKLGSDMADALRSAQFCHVIPESTLLRMETENNVDRICGLIRDHSRAMAVLMRRKRFLLTSEGRVAVGNRNLLPGDLICCFYGLAMPFKVRPKGPHYVLISPVIVDRTTLSEMWPQDHDEMVPWEIA